MGILKEVFSAYSSPVMLISRKLTKDKRMVTDFRHLNVRIAKNNLAYPLVRDTFSVLGNSRCEVLSVLDWKDAFRSLRLSENIDKCCIYVPYMAAIENLLLIILLNFIQIIHVYTWICTFIHLLYTLDFREY